MSDDNEKPKDTERATSFALDLRGGVELMCTHVPGRKKPYLGIKKGNQFVALAQFLSGADMTFLREVLEARIIVIQPIEVSQVAQDAETD